MQNQTKKFSFNEPELATFVVESLYRALEIDMPDLMDDYQLECRNGYGQFTWNFIIREFSLSSEPLDWIELGLCKRGGWVIPVLHIKKNGYNLTCMTEKTFEAVRKRKDKGKHYLCGATRPNTDVKVKANQLAIEFPDIESQFEKFISKSSEDLANAVKCSVDDIKGHILVLFNRGQDKLISVRAVRLTPSLEISEEVEDWSKYLPSPYISDTEIDLDKKNDEDENEDDGLVQLR